MYFHGTKAAICVYDITNSDSFEGAKSWIKELREKSKSNLVVVLCGNKKDMNDSRQVRFDEASAYAENNDLVHIETSAKTGEGVDHMFDEIARRLPEAEKKLEENRKKAHELQIELLKLERSGSNNLDGQIAEIKKELLKTGRSFEVKDLDMKELKEELRNIKTKMGLPDSTEEGRGLNRVKLEDDDEFNVNKKKGGDCC